MSDRIVVIDVPTATAMAQILPLLLLTTMIELRRNALHRRISRIFFAVFFSCFSVIETALVLSIDGSIYPFRWGDLVCAVVIFALLTVIFVITIGGFGDGSESD